MKIDVYNQKGEITGSANLPKEIFDVKFNADLVHQVTVALAANERQTSAHTKFRGEVRGGGKKPWRQKGTGRARHGSIRSPLWKGGGVTHGPRVERIFEREIPKKIRRKALIMVLSQKADNKQIVLLDKIELAKPAKTKDMVSSLKKLPCEKGTLLMAVPGQNKDIYLASRNIKNVTVEDVRNLNALKILNNKFLLLTKDSVKIIEETFTK